MQATDQTLETLHEQLVTQSRSMETGECFRLAEQDDKLVVTVEEPNVEDTTFEYDGRTVLAVTQDAAQRCGDRTLILDDKKWVLR